MLVCTAVHAGSGKTLPARKLSDELLYGRDNIHRAVVHQHRDHVSQLDVQIGFLLPEVTIGEWCFAQTLQRDRYEISQTDLLLDHLPQVFDGEPVDRLTPQRMAP